MGWMRTKVDGLGRVVEAEHFKGAVPPYPWGSNATSTGKSSRHYGTDVSLNQATDTVADENDVTRRLHRDALGRLKRAVEDPATLNYLTTYTNDIFGNVIIVSQGVQSRSLVFDSLNRLRSTTNPESGTINYTHDVGGNVLTRTDARNVARTMTYDGLNRLRTKVYSNITPVTPAVTYSYDDPAVPFSRGRLTKVSNSISVTEYSEYDVLGRIRQSRQITDWNAFPLSYEYNLAGSLTEQVHPSGRKITYAYDDAAMLTRINGEKTGEVPKSYVSQGGYTPPGALAQMQFGNGLWEHRQFNTRLQTAVIGVGRQPRAELRCVELGLHITRRRTTELPFTPTTCGLGASGMFAGTTGVKGQIVGSSATWNSLSLPQRRQLTDQEMVARFCQHSSFRGWFRLLGATICPRLGNDRPNNLPLSY